MHSFMKKKTNLNSFKSTTQICAMFARVINTWYWHWAMFLKYPQNTIFVKYVQVWTYIRTRKTRKVVFSSLCLQRNDNVFAHDTFHAATDTYVLSFDLFNLILLRSYRDELIVESRSVCNVTLRNHHAGFHHSFILEMISV